MCEGLKQICDQAFYSCSSLRNVIIPQGVTEIGNNAFENCLWLINISIPDTVTQINDEVFDDCRCIESITIPESIKRIGKYAFSSCYSLKSIVIPDSVEEIHNTALYQCQALESAVIPKSVTVKGRKNDLFFAECYKLSKVFIGEYKLDRRFCNFTNFILEKILSIINNNDFSVEVDRLFKDLLAPQMAVKTNSPEAAAYIKQSKANIIIPFIYMNCTSFQVLSK